MTDTLRNRLGALVRECREEAHNINCQSYSGLGYTAHIATRCPACITLALADKVEGALAAQPAPAPESREPGDQS